MTSNYSLALIIQITMSSFTFSVIFLGKFRFLTLILFFFDRLLLLIIFQIFRLIFKRLLYILSGKRPGIEKRVSVPEKGVKGVGPHWVQLIVFLLFFIVFFSENLFLFPHFSLGFIVLLDLVLVLFFVFFVGIFYFLDALLVLLGIFSFFWLILLLILLLLLLLLGAVVFWPVIPGLVEKIIKHRVECFRHSHW